MSHVVFEFCVLVVFYLIMGVWAWAIHLDEENPERGILVWPVILIELILELLSKRK